MTSSNWSHIEKTNFGVLATRTGDDKISVNNENIIDVHNNNKNKETENMYNMQKMIS